MWIVYHVLIIMLGAGDIDNIIKTSPLVLKQFPNY